jgi:hypothetical protein
VGVAVAPAVRVEPAQETKDVIAHRVAPVGLDVKRPARGVDLEVGVDLVVEHLLVAPPAAHGIAHGDFGRRSRRWGLVAIGPICAPVTAGWYVVAIAAT